MTQFEAPNRPVQLKARSRYNDWLSMTASVQTIVAEATLESLWIESGVDRGDPEAMQMWLLDQDLMELSRFVKSDSEEAMWSVFGTSRKGADVLKFEEVLNRVLIRNGILAKIHAAPKRRVFFFMP